MRIIAAFTCLALALATGAADAGPKLYRWVDAAGNVRYSDHLPPEEVDRARREISFRSGLTTAEVDRALTDEERDAALAEAARLAEAALREEREQLREGALLGSYPVEADLQRAYDERAALLEETLEATRIGIAAQRQSLMSLLGHAADRELSGRQVDTKTRELVTTQRAQLDEQLLALHRREAERAALELEYRDILERYRAVHGR